MALEIGFDHGNVILDSARALPDVRWLGVEVRRARVEAAAPHAPPNALLVRGDARGLLSAVVPPGRLAWISILFPTPSHDPRHLLFTPATAELFARSLEDGGRVHVSTDVPGMARLVERIFAGWTPAEEPPRGTELSRRERVCRRDGRQVWKMTAGKERERK